MRPLFAPLLLHLVMMLTLAACANQVTDLAPNVSDSDLLYGDEFGADSVARWTLEGDEFGSTVIQDGRLVIDVSQASVMQFATLVEPTFADFDLVVDTQLLEGFGEATYGLLFRMVGPEQFYRFELTGDGHYVIERRDAGDAWQRLGSGWQKSDAITTGPGAMNRLRVTAEGPAMVFYVNDELLQEVRDETYGAGQIALDAGTFGEQRTIANFDNLAISAP